MHVLECDSGKEGKVWFFSVRLTDDSEHDFELGNISGNIGVILDQVTIWKGFVNQLNIIFVVSKKFARNQSLVEEVSEQIGAAVPLYVQQLSI